MLRFAARLSSGRLAAAFSAACSALSRSCSQLAQDQAQQWHGLHSSSCSDGRSGSRSNISHNSSGSSSSSEPEHPTPEQAAAADRLLALSKGFRVQQQTSDEQLRQRILLYMLQLGFSAAAIEKHIRSQKGGPYAAWATVGELVALLRREGFSQQQLNGLLAGSSKSDSAAGGVFTRAPADVAANLAWLQQQFGLEPAGLAKACSQAPGLLGYKSETLQANWRAIVEAYRPTAAAMKRLRTALQAGFAEFLLLQTATVGEKVAVLQELLGLPDEDVPDKFGALARLFGMDLNAADDGPVQRLTLLQELTGRSYEQVAASILVFPALLRIPTATLRRKHDAIVQALGGDAETAKLLLSRYPGTLAAAEARVPRNLATLQRLGCSSPQVAVQVLLKNGRLAQLNLEQPAFAARVAYWQQAYELESAEAAVLKCAEMLHRSLRTVAPRVAFWRSCRPGQPLPTGTSTFTVGDSAFCKQQRLPGAQFPAFKRRWLASEEGRLVCRWEQVQEAGPAAAEMLSSEPDE